MRNQEKSKDGVGTPMDRARARQRIAARPAPGQTNPFVSMEFESRDVKWGPRTTRSINHCPYTFRVGSSIPDLQASYGKKPVCNFNGEMVVAEIAVLRLLQEAGWNGVWVDPWQNKNKYRNALPPQCCELPAHAQEFLNRISGSKKWPRGCWDVFAWKDERYLFVECKRKGRDSLRPGQKKWLASALKSGIPQSSFIIFDWDFE